MRPVGTSTQVNHGGPVGIRQKFVSSQRAERLTADFLITAKQQGWLLTDRRKLRWGVYEANYCRNGWQLTFHAEDRGSGQTTISLGVYLRDDSPTAQCKSEIDSGSAKT